MTTQTLRVARMLSPVTSLGPGRRLGLWVQGCDLGCRGCASRDTWDRAGGTLVAVDELARQIAAVVAHDDLTGLTLTGGEPIDQAADLASVVDRVRETADDLDVLVFTGYAPSAARRRGRALWECADTVVAGPYRQDLPSEDPIRASANQVLVQRTELGRRRFAEEPPQRHLQVCVDQGDIQLVGLPRPGDLERWRRDLASSGVRLKEVSWLN